MHKNTYTCAHTFDSISLHLYNHTWQLIIGKFYLSEKKKGGTF